MESLEDGTLDALGAVQMLFEDMYEGYTFNLELKARWARQFDDTIRTPLNG